jgi:hypothetical protein
MSLFQAKHTWESVLVEIVQGVENGTVKLESSGLPPDRAEKNREGVISAFGTPAPIVLLIVLLLGDAGLMIASLLCPTTPLLIAILCYQFVPLGLAIWFGIEIAKQRAASKQVAADLKEITNEVGEAVKEAEKQGILATAPYARLVQLSHRLEAVEQQAQENAGP